MLLQLLHIQIRNDSRIVRSLNMLHTYVFKAELAQGSKHEKKKVARMLKCLFPFIHSLNSYFSSP